MSTANDHQVGGRHYKVGYEHWDLVTVMGMGYLDGCATKYLSRWRKKAGLQDLQKALHYTAKLIEGVLSRDIQMPTKRVRMDRACQEILKFSAENQLEGPEEDAILRLSTWRDVKDLLQARDLIESMIEDVKAEAVPLTEENHHADRAGETR